MSILGTCRLKLHALCTGAFWWYCFRSQRLIPLGIEHVSQVDNCLALEGFRATVFSTSCAERRASQSPESFLTPGRSYLSNTFLVGAGPRSNQMVGLAYDEETEAKLRQFDVAKQQQDSATVDKIRSELHAKGINADSVAVVRGGAMYDSQTQAQVDRLLTSFRNKDGGSRDAARKELRAKGLDPDLVAESIVEEKLDRAQTMSGRLRSEVHPRPLLSP